MEFEGWEGIFILTVVIYIIIVLKLVNENNNG